MNESKIYETCINSKLKEWGITYVQIKDDIILKHVYDLYKNNRYVNCDDAIYLHHAGLYSDHVIKNTVLSEQYYLLATNKGYSRSMNNLAVLYNEQKKYHLAEKYYLMAIENGNIISIYNLALLYEKQTKLDLAEKYYLMAIEKGHTDSMCKLAILYNKRNKNDSAEKYYLMAIEKGCIKSMYNLARLYKTQEKYEISRHCYVMCAFNHHKKAIRKINKLIQHHFDLEDSIKLINVLDNYNHNILNDVLKFAINGIL